MAKITKHEVELEKIRRAYEFRQSIVNGLTCVFTVLSFGLPLYFVKEGVGLLAGKTTLVSSEASQLVGQMVGGGSALCVIVALLLKNQRQKSELQRLRCRCDELERSFLESSMLGAK